VCDARVTAAGAPYSDTEDVGISQRSDGAEHVFISYVREDAERVNRLERLLKRKGIIVWRDTSDLWPGQDWKIEIRRAIERGVAFIACFSEHTERRRSSYQNEELAVAADEMRRRPPGEVWLFPVRFAECRLPSFDLGAGRSLYSLQLVDLLDGATWEPRVARLAVMVRDIRGGPKAQAAPSDHQQDRPMRGADIETEVDLSSTDAAVGGAVILHLKDSCQACSGTGGWPRACPDCGGTGIRDRHHGTSEFSEPCKTCQRHGRVIDEPCPSCSGSGLSGSSHSIQARFPANIKDGQRLRLKAKGHPGQHGGPAGDLYVLVHVTP
jgi:hypothetical protein